MIGMEQEKIAAADCLQLMAEICVVSLGGTPEVLYVVLGEVYDVR
jgi:hypothetical protein